MHAFVDESHRGAYLLVVTLLKPTELERTRTLLRSLRVGGERRLHFKHESDAVKRMIAARLAQSGVRTRVYTGRGGTEGVRRSCLAHLVSDLIALDARRLVLEARGREEDRRDRRTIGPLLRGAGGDGRLVYEHLRPHEEPSLWISDAVAWCHGAGGGWRRRVSPIIEQVLDVGGAGHDSRGRPWWGDLRSWATRHHGRRTH